MSLHHSTVPTDYLSQDAAFAHPGMMMSREDTTLTTWGLLFPADGGAPLKLHDQITIGRSPECSVVVPDERISSVHCTLELRKSFPCVTDTSFNGLFINRKRAPKGRGIKIGAGDILQLTPLGKLENGKYRFVAEFYFQPRGPLVAQEAFRPRTSFGATSKVGNHNNSSPTASSSNKSGGGSSPLLAMRVPRWEQPAQRFIIGRGATSQVFLAIDSDTGEHLAVKEILKPPKLLNRAERRRQKLTRRTNNNNNNNNIQNNDDDDDDSSFDDDSSSSFDSSSSGYSSDDDDDDTLSSNCSSQTENYAGNNNNNNNSSSPDNEEGRCIVGNNGPPQRLNTDNQFEPKQHDDDDENDDDAAARQDAALNLVTTEKNKKKKQQQQQHHHHHHHHKKQEQESQHLFRDLKELAMLLHLGHERIVKFKGAEETDECYRLFFEYISGGSMSDLLHKFGHLSDNVVRLYTLQVLIGMLYLHSSTPQVVHGDLKPGNILVSDDGKVKITDFGTSLFVDRGRKATGCTPAAAATSVIGGGRGGGGGGMMIGSPCYMSPEMCRGARASFASDVWALGCTVLEMATGRPPWYECNFTESVAAVYHIGRVGGDPSGNGHPNMELLEGRSPHLYRFVKQCFHPDPQKRPTIEQLLQDPFICGTNNENDNSNNNNNNIHQHQHQQQQNGVSCSNASDMSRNFSFLDDDECAPQQPLSSGGSNTNSASEKPALLAQRAKHDLREHRLYLESTAKTTTPQSFASAASNNHPSAGSRRQRGREAGEEGGEDVGGGGGDDQKRGDEHQQHHQHNHPSATNFPSVPGNGAGSSGLTTFFGNLELS